MGRPRIEMVLLAAGLVGCNVRGDGSVADATRFPDTAIDGPYQASFACAGIAWPTTAPDPLALNGRVISPATALPLGNVAVAMHKTSNDSLLGQAISTNGGAFAGTYSIAAATGGAALATYRKAVLAGRVDAYAYDPFAVYNGPTGGLTIYSPTQAEVDAYYAAGGITNDPAKGTLQINVADCLGVALAEATVTAPGAARVIYLDDHSAVDANRSKTSRAGVAIVLGVPVGVANVVIAPAAPALVFRTWPVTSFANSYTSGTRYP